MFLAHTFLAYFVGVRALAHWVTRSPFEHPVAFLVMAGTTALMLLDFGWFREQVCMVACPYGRFQSVLLDRRSLIVGYDHRRGEPRGKLGRQGLALVAVPAQAGDCIDCGACVVACPTGIDIRDGLQMECIHCTQCMDACDSIMDRIGRPRGLIRYSSRDELGGAPRRILRPRVVLYPVLVRPRLGRARRGARPSPACRRHRAARARQPVHGAAFGAVSNQIRVKIVNRDGVDHRYRIEVEPAGGPRGEPLEMIAPDNPLPVAAGKSATATVFVTAPQGGFDDGRREVRFRISDGAGWSDTVALPPARPRGTRGSRGAPEPGAP